MNDDMTPDYGDNESGLDQTEEQQEFGPEQFKLMSSKLLLNCAAQMWETLEKQSKLLRAGADAIDTLKARNANLFAAYTDLADQLARADAEIIALKDELDGDKPDPENR